MFYNLSILKKGTLSFAVCAVKYVADSSSPIYLILALHLPSQFQ